MSKKDVKTNLLSHSEAKVRLLGEYLKRYLNIICNDGYTKKIKIFDLFCGEGIYENGGEGSPLVIMRQVQEAYLANQGKSTNFPKIDCLFNDLKEEKTKKVESAIKSLELFNPMIGKLMFSNLDYQGLYSNLIQTLPSFKQNNEKAFIFIDPYEYKHIKANQIKNLMLGGSSEVLLWLPTQFMYRFANNGTPEALKDFITEIIPDFDTWKPGNVWHFIAELKKGFQNFLGDNFFVDTFTIQKDANTVFCLFFFTSHIKGFEKMLETKWELDAENGRGWEYKGNDPTLFFGQKTNELELKLREFLISKKCFNSDVYRFTLKQGYLPKHTNEIFKFWQKNKILEVIPEKVESIRQGAFYVKYFHQNHPEFKKVYFKLQ